MHDTRMPPKADGGRRLLSVRAAAQAASCSDDTIRRHIRQGTLHARRLGPTGNLRVSPEDLDHWLQPFTEDKSL